MHDVAVNCVRSKDAQKQLARTSLRLQSVSLCWNTVSTIVSPSLSHKEMLQKSFDQMHVDEDKRL